MSAPRFSSEDLLAHRDFVRRLARRLVSSAEDAEDLEQQAWLRAVPARGDALRSQRAWLSRVLRRLASNHRRGEERRQRREQIAPAALPTDDHVESLQRLETCREVADAVMALPEATRTAITLRYYEDLSPSAVADRLGLPAETVRARLKYGHRLLRRRLAGAGDGPGSRSRLMVLAGLGPAAMPASKSILTFGVLGMHAGKILGAAAAALLLTAGWMWHRSSPEQPVPEAERPHALASESTAFDGEEASEPLIASRVEDLSSEEQPPLGGTAEEGETSSVRGQGVVLHGSVVDAQGRGLAGARVSCSPGEGFSGRQSVETDGAGAFRLAMGILERPSEGRLSIQLAGYQILQRPVPLAPEEDQDLGELPLQQAAWIEGRVILPPGVGSGHRHIVAVPVDEVRPLLRARSEHPTRRIVLDDIWALLSRPGTVPSTWGEDFRFDHLEPVPTVILVLQPGCRGFLSETLDLSVEPSIENLELRLQLSDRAATIAGVVHDPQGRGLRAKVRFRGVKDGGRRGTTGEVVSGESGEFRFEAPEGYAELELSVDDWNGELVGASCTARPGDTSVVLQLREARRIQLRVVDEAGDPVVRFFALAVSTEEHRLIGNLPRSALDGYTAHGTLLQNLRTQGDNRYDYPFAVIGEFPDGAVELRIPPGIFRLHVEAVGHEVLVAGPFDGETMERELELRLPTAPGIRGIVTDGTGPLAGASVTLHRAAEEGAWLGYQSFRCRSTPQVSTRATSDADGRFRLELREDGDFFVRASLDGFAATDLGPLSVNREKGLADLELELGEGGTLRVVVIPCEGQDPRTVTVGISRADGFVQKAMPDVDGLVVFEHCTPGPWEVCETEPIEDRMMRTGVSFAGAESGPWPPYEWAGEVREGETTEVELDLSQTRSILEGRLLVNDHAPEEWSVWLSGDRDPFDSGLQPLKSITRDDGSYRAQRLRPGPSILQLSWRTTEGHVSVHDRLTLEPGVQHHSIELSTVTLPGTLPAPPPPDTFVEFEAQGPGERTVTARTKPDDQGRFTFPAVPIGRVLLRHGPRREPLAQLELDVPADGSREVHASDW